MRPFDFGDFNPDGLGRADLLSMLVDAALMGAPEDIGAMFADDGRGRYAGLSTPPVPAAMFAADDDGRGRLVADFYSPDQPRDERGRWTEGAGAGMARDYYRQQVREYAKKTGFPTREEAAALADHLSRMTVGQLHDLRREHGLKASGIDKAGLVRRLAERFAEHRAKNPTPAAGKSPMVYTEGKSAGLEMFQPTPEELAYMRRHSWGGAERKAAEAAQSAIAEAGRHEAAREEDARIRRATIRQGDAVDVWHNRALVGGRETPKTRRSVRIEAVEDAGNGAQLGRFTYTDEGGKTRAGYINTKTDRWKKANESEWVKPEEVDRALASLKGPPVGSPGAYSPPVPPASVPVTAAAQVTKAADKPAPQPSWEVPPAYRGFRAPDGDSIRKMNDKVSLQSLRNVVNEKIERLETGQENKGGGWMGGGEKARKIDIGTEYARLHAIDTRIAELETTRPTSLSVSASPVAVRPLSPLSGSPAQIPIAGAIRTRILADAERYIRQREAANHPEAADDRKALDQLRQEHRAGWWMDNRRRGVADLLDEVYRRKVAAFADEAAAWVEKQPAAGKEGKGLAAVEPAKGKLFAFSADNDDDGRGRYVG